MEDVEVLSILGSLTKEDMLNDKLYQKLMNEKFSHINAVIPTTRDLTIPKLFVDLKNMDFRNILMKLPYLNKPGSLNYLFSINLEFYIDYIGQNFNILEEFFSEEYLSSLKKKLKKGWGTNRLTNFFKRRYTSDFLRDYDLIFPVCIIALVKQWNNE